MTYRLEQAAAGELKPNESWVDAQRRELRVKVPYEVVFYRALPAGAELFFGRSDPVAQAALDALHELLGQPAKRDGARGALERALGK